MRVGTMDVTVEVFADGVLVNGKAERYHVVIDGKRARIKLNGRMGKDEIACATLDAVGYLHAEETAKVSVTLFAGPKLYVPLVPPSHH